MGKETNYQRGARYERKVQTYYEATGALVVRSAASKSPVDLVVINQDGTYLLIQVKSTRWGKPVLPDVPSHILRYGDMEWWCWCAARKQWAVFVHRWDDVTWGESYWLTTKEAYKYAEYGEDYDTIPD